MKAFADLYSVDEKTIKSQYSTSITVIEKMVALFTEIQALRETSKWAYFCINCGAPQSSSYKTCLNKEKCKERTKTINKQLSREPLSLPGLNCTKSDVWNLVEKYDKTQIRQNYGFYASESLWKLLPPNVSKEHAIDVAI